jgi:two-component system, sensor histidine kinase and response regulator
MCFFCVIIIYVSRNCGIKSFSCRCIVKDKDIFFTEPSPQMCRFFGTAPESYTEGILARIRRDISSESADILGKNVFAKAAAGEDFRIVYPSMRADGSKCQMQVDGYFQKRTDEGYLYDVIEMDISELIEARETAKRQEQEFEKQYKTAESYIESISGSYVATMRVNVTRNIVEMINGTDPLMTAPQVPSYDDAMERLMASMPRRQDKFECVRKFSRDSLLTAYFDGRISASLDYLYKNTNGAIMWARCTMTLTRRPGSNDVISFSAVHDITKNKITELIMNNVIIREYDHIACIDAGSGSLTLVSRNEQSSPADELHGGDDYEEIMHEYIQRHVIPEEKDACASFMKLSAVIEDLEKNGKHSGSFTVSEDGAFRNKRIDYSYIDRESGLISLIRTDFTDIQQQQIQQEQQLREALSAARLASDAKTEFLSHMSHEIRTPMNAIIGLDEIALREKTLDPEVKGHLEKIGLSAKYLLSLINDILDMNRIESGKISLSLTTFSFRKFVDSINVILESQCSEKGISYTCSVSGETAETYSGDELKLQQILVNILGNSVKFTDPGGAISFSAEQTGCEGNRAAMRFVIKDTGRGIDSAFLPHIFEPFSQEDSSSTTTYGGSGLGLAITKSLVELMSGTISVESEKGRGTQTIVNVMLDKVQTASEPVSAEQNRELPPGKFAGKKLLMAEDNEINREIGRTMLEADGFTVDTVDNGRKAVDAFSASVPGTYAAILMDIRMPVMDGLEAARSIRSLHRPDAQRIPVVAISANAFDEDIKKSLANGMNAHITKPIDGKIMHETLEKLISG